MATSLSSIKLFMLTTGIGLMSYQVSHALPPVLEALKYGAVGYGATNFLWSVGRLSEDSSSLDTLQSYLPSEIPVKFLVAKNIQIILGILAQKKLAPEGLAKAAFESGLPLYFLVNAGWDFAKAYTMAQAEFLAPDTSTAYTNNPTLNDLCDLPTGYDVPNAQTDYSVNSTTDTNHELVAPAKDIPWEAFVATAAGATFMTFLTEAIAKGLADTTAPYLGIPAGAPSLPKILLEANLSIIMWFMGAKAFFNWAKHPESLGYTTIGKYCKDTSTESWIDKIYSASSGLSFAYGSSSPAQDVWRQL